MCGACSVELGGTLVPFQIGRYDLMSKFKFELFISIVALNHGLGRGDEVGTTDTHNLGHSRTRTGVLSLRTHPSITL